MDVVGKWSMYSSSSGCPGLIDSATKKAATKVDNANFK